MKVPVMLILTNIVQKLHGTGIKREVTRISRICMYWGIQKIHGKCAIKETKYIDFKLNFKFHCFHEFSE